jgi:hypothetical protein
MWNAANFIYAVYLKYTTISSVYHENGKSGNVSATAVISDLILHIGLLAI